MSSLHRLDPGKVVSIDELSTSGRDYCSDRKAAEKERKSLRKEMFDWQQRFYAAQDRKLLIVLQAMDAGGKDGTIRRVFEGIDPRGIRVDDLFAKRIDIRRLE